MDAPLVYIIILNWNGWRDTIECLRSLELLSYTGFEIVVVDNGSTNESVSRLREAYPTLTILETGHNLGFAGGNNVGIQHAVDRGAQYVWLLNNDTKVDPQALSSMIAIAKTDDNIGAVGSVLYHMDRPDTVQVWGGGFVTWYGVVKHHSGPVAADGVHYISGASLLLGRNALLNQGVLDSGFFMYWEDADLGFRLRKAGWKLAVAEGSRVLHKESASVGKKSPLQDAYFAASTKRFFRRHASVPALPVLVLSAGWLVNRVLRGEWGRIRARFGGRLRAN